MRKNVKNIKNYWNKRASQYGADPKATTDDYWLRILEINNIKNVLRGITKRRNVLDIGCGDGFSTLSIAQDFPQSNFVGGDYSMNMIKNAQNHLRDKSETNILFKIIDVMDLEDYKNKFDVVISDRCLINLPEIDSQQEAIKQIKNSLRPKGFYIMVENFIEGHKSMNKMRSRIGLNEIPIRWHNTFLAETFISKFVKKHFKILKEKNISSLYYLLTRIVYSKVCQLENRGPDYNNSIYQVATEINEVVGDYGPIKLLLLQKI